MSTDALRMSTGSEKSREFASGDLYFSQLSMRPGHQLQLQMEEEEVWAAWGERSYAPQ